MSVDTQVEGVPGGRFGLSSWVIWGLGALLCVGIAAYSFRYLPLLVAGAPAILANALSRPWLYLHIMGAAPALLIAPFQLLPALRRAGRPWHRWLGRTYLVCCLIGGTGGLVAAFGSTGGPIATAGFACLAVVWLAVNAMGWRRATQRRFVEHRRWMICSFALTFAAVTLRIYMPLFFILRPAHITILAWYQAVAWLCWVPNLAVAALYLRATASKPIVVR